LSKLQFLDDNIYLVTVTEKIVMVIKNSKGDKKMIVLSTDKVVVCIGTKRDIVGVTYICYRDRGMFLRVLLFFTEKSKRAFKTDRV